MIAMFPANIIMKGITEAKRMSNHGQIFECRLANSSFIVHLPEATSYSFGLSDVVPSSDIFDELFDSGRSAEWFDGYIRYEVKKKCELSTALTMISINKYIQLYLLFEYCLPQHTIGRPNTIT